MYNTSVKIKDEIFFIRKDGHKCLCKSSKKMKKI